MCSRLLNLRQLQTFKRSFSSALYVTGDKAQNTYVVLIPHIDFEQQIQNKPELIRNIRARNLKIDVDKVEARWNFYKMLKAQKVALETTRNKINNSITRLKNNPENQRDIDKLVLHIKLVKNDLKNIKDYSYGIEEYANLAVLSLPNVLNPKTPIESDEIVYECLEKPLGMSENHLKIGQANNLIDYASSMYCYLKADAALWEFSVGNYVQKKLLNAGFVQTSNADFARSIVVEGCGVNYADGDNIFTLKDPHNDQTHEISRLHLVGGASIYAFMTYFARHTISSNCFPLKFFTLGRSYQPVSENNASLFNLSQQSVAQVFIAHEHTDEKDLFPKLESNIREIYEPLGYHFRLVYVAANRLELAESMRLSVQMFSNFEQKYVEVGRLSLYENYLSKRLLFNYNDSVNNERMFPKVIAGQLINVHKCLGCVLENNSVNGAPLLTDLLREYVM